LAINESLLHCKKKAGTCKPRLQLKGCEKKQRKKSLAKLSHG
jgi:hypothetical protein